MLTKETIKLIQTVLIMVGAKVKVAEDIIKASCQAINQMEASK